MSLHKKLAVSLAIGSTLLLSACSTGASAESNSDDRVTISFASYTLAMDGPAADGTEALIAAFEAEHPEIDVETRAIPNSDILTKTRTDLAAGDGADVVQMGYSRVREAMTTLPVQSIELAAGDEWDEVASVLPSGMLDTGIWDGTNHAVPFTVSTPTLFFNASLLESVGADPANPPSTMSEIREVSQKLVDAGHYGVHFSLATESKADFMAQSVLNSGGGSLVSEDGEEVTIDSAGSVAGMQAIADLVKDGLMPDVLSDDAQVAFTQGDLGMIVTTTAYSGSFQATADDGGWELGSAGFPDIIDGMDARPTHSGAALMMLADDEATQAASWEFINFMATPEAQQIITEQIGYLPLRADMVDDPEGLGAFFEENPLLLPAVEQLADIAPYQFFPGDKSNQATVTFHDEAVEPILVRGADVESTLKSVAESIRSEQ